MSAAIRWSAMAAATVLAVACGNGSSGHGPPQPQRLTAATSAQQQAQRDADEILTHASAPPGATSTSRPPSPRLQDPYSMPSVRSIVDRHRTWRIDMSLDAVADWYKSHPPAGFTTSESGSGGGPAFRVVQFGYDAPAQRPGGPMHQLQIELTNLTDSSSGIRADALVEWLDDTPYRDTSPGPRLRVTVASGCPRSDRGAVGVRNTGADLRRRLLPDATPSGGLVCGYAGGNGAPPLALVDHHELDRQQAGRLAKAVSALPLSHLDGGETNCPMDDGTAAVLILSYPGRDDVDLWYAETGCSSIANGMISTRTGDLRSAAGLR